MVIFYKNRKHKNCNIDFINSHVCFVKCTKDNNNFLIIFIHLPYDDLTNNSLFEFDSNLTILSDLLSFYLSKNFKCFLSGDFNADLKRNKRFD